VIASFFYTFTSNLKTLIMKLLLLLLCCKGLFNCCGNDKRDGNGIVNIPDANFKAYLVGDSAINTNGDKEIQVSEASAFNDTIDCSQMNISNLKGIEAFTALIELYCFGNNLDSLDVSKNTALTELFCTGNQLRSLDVSKNTALTELDCNENQLTSLDVSKNTALTFLDCSKNQLTSLDVSKNTALGWLYCDGNKFDCAALISKYGIENIEGE
jgi:Leucine-rich repeat (LRR) protein